MKNALLIFVFITSACHFIRAQTTFNFKRHDSQQFIKMIPSLGGGYYALGGFDSTEVTRLDSNLNFLWQKKIVSDGIASLFQCKNGDLLFTGMTGNNAFAIRTDSLLNILWANQYQNAANWSMGVQIIEHSDKSIFVLGIALDYYLTHSKPFTLLMKLGSSGNLIWAKLNGANYSSSGVDLIESTDNHLIFCDMQFSLNGNHADICKLDTNGIGIWNTMVATTGMWGPYGDPDDLCITYDGGCAALVNAVNPQLTGSAVELHVTDQYGNFENELYELPDGANGTWDFINIIGIQTSDSGFAFSGNLNLPGFNYALVKLDSTLHVQWCKAYRSSLSNSSSFLEQSHDGGFLIGTNDQQNTMLLKTDAFGNINCYDTTLIVTETNAGTGTAYNIFSFMLTPTFTTINYPVVNSSSLTSVWDTVCYDLSSALQENLAENITSLQVYPNPADDMLSVDIGAGKSIEDIRINDALGNLVLTPENFHSVDVSSLARGLYIVEVSFREGKAFGKFLKR